MTRMSLHFTGCKGGEALVAITSDLIDGSFGEFYFVPDGLTTCLSCHRGSDGHLVFEEDGYFEHLGSSSLGLEMWINSPFNLI